MWRMNLFSMNLTSFGFSTIQNWGFSAGLNNGPTLSWTGEAGYESDGINPDSGNGGQNFVFRVNYTDDEKAEADRLYAKYSQYL